MLSSAIEEPLYLPRAGKQHSDDARQSGLELVLVEHEHDCAPGDQVYLLAVLVPSVNAEPRDDWCLLAIPPGFLVKPEHRLESGVTVKLRMVGRRHVLEVGYPYLFRPVRLHDEQRLGVPVPVVLCLSFFNLYVPP